MADHEHVHAGQEHKLSLIRSPVVGEKHVASSSSSVRPLPGNTHVESLGFRDGPRHNCPEFEKVRSGRQLRNALVVVVVLICEASTRRLPTWRYLDPLNLQRLYATLYNSHCLPQLFFDLFFAANLAVFSKVHEVTNKSQLSSYIGYFWYEKTSSRLMTLVG
jgi:hypothetical protein